jgi:hypothetical protein
VYKADNPPAGAIINYYLKAAPKDDVVVTIADKTGKTIRTLRTAPKNAGVNRTVWDLRYDGPRQGPTFGGRGGGGRGAAAAEGAPAEEGAGGGGRFGGGGGPSVVPGEYIIKVRAAGREESKPVKVEMDPRVPVSAADLQAQLDAALTLREMTSRVNLTIQRANDLVQQLTALQERLKRSAPVRSPSTSSPGAGGTSSGPSVDGANGVATGVQPAASSDLLALVTAALDASKKLLEDDLTRPYPGMGYRQYPRLREEIQSLSGSVSRAAARPTDPQMLRMKELQQELDDAVARFNRIQTEQVSKINELMKTAPFIQMEMVR